CRPASPAISIHERRLPARPSFALEGRRAQGSPPMKLEVVIDGRTRTLELDDTAPAGGPCQFALDSQAATADVREVEPGVYCILLDGHSYEVRIEASTEACSAAVNGRRYSVEVRDPRRLSHSRGAIAVAGRQRVTSPMPGKVVR